jgi:F0F1-type ATP synthase membrane subunit a
MGFIVKGGALITLLMFLFKCILLIIIVPLITFILIPTGVISILGAFSLFVVIFMCILGLESLVMVVQAFIITVLHSLYIEESV